MFVRLVTHRGNFRDDLLVDEICDLFFERRAIHVERNFRDDELLAVPLHFLDANASAQFQAAFAGRKIIFNPLDATNETSGREVRPLDEFHQFRNRDVRVVNLRTDAFNHFAEIMRCHVRSHADRDAGAAIDEQIGKGRRKNLRFSEAFVVVRGEIYRVLFHVLHQRGAEMRQSRLGITHRRRRIIFDRTEIAFAINQFLAHHPRLRHVHERRINHRFTVRMVIAGSIAANLRALIGLASGKQRQLVHRVKDAPL